ncbi:Thiol-disulfide interchange protein, contains DsbC and DsbD domains [Pontibaca methylaminivorans]|uniref:Thiol-disulfide interchange protein, contains DsbC and DsbD domains n=2 Tax=Pontibaca methylaminivorans TaxID=515897 RepID=A0A1R3WTD4_9RHOB|nr:Thiol-disulfide interchange protein, contains DsbC and DsbD domains [Pontibaca methylaminivorans]
MAFAASFVMVLALLLTAAPAAAQSAIPDPDRLVRLRVLDGGTTAEGTRMAALELTLAEGWKTYWRSPGEAGIPPRFDWSGSQNLGQVQIHWPTPMVFEQSGYRSFGYADRLVLPVEITPEHADQDVRLAGRMDLGLCSDICIPGNVSFDQALDAAAPRDPQIVAALADRPSTAREAGVTGASCSMQPTQDGIRLTARIDLPPPSTGSEVAVIEPGVPGVWAGQAETRREGPQLVTSTEFIDETGEGLALDRSKIRITVFGGAQAADIRGCSGE